VPDTGPPPTPKFHAACTFLPATGSAGPGAGQSPSAAAAAADGSGNVYVADTHNNRIQKFDANGTFLTSWGGQFAFPSGVATDGSGNVYATDTRNNRNETLDASATFPSPSARAGTTRLQSTSP